MANAIHFLFLLITLNLVRDLDSRPSNGKSYDSRPKVSFTFDDGSTRDMPNYTLEEWNEMILTNLRKHQAKAVFFANVGPLQNEKGKYVLSSWDKAGHKIANHTYTHPRFSDPKTTLEMFKTELLRNDSVIRSYPNFYQYFRFPYLKEGETKEKVEGFRAFLKEKGYKNGHVTIDASDWYIASRLVERLKENPQTDVSAFRDFYIEHMFDRAVFYDGLADQLTGRKINHTILLHHNLASALFLDDLIAHFKDKGWEIIDAEEAFKDPIFNEVPMVVPAGESLIWALAKQSGKYDKDLRYPAENGDYLKAKMDSLGL
ncbi:polysaccharide deacetylase family protein [Aquiflexum sp. TKW24L]|uniref:polysaccharide deacetylase family protein n=1 Tax=Aquiflexum sp. TKW24L TaxID=2942212 RepID=UPI0020BEA8E7|nr:polysaccharide deacetylase family protein [Aquiflexum sp. TKW24L]MCL6260622.1 polysaccharide deacetylase family protein [Aquiflexum sp. TKW24L]